MQRSRYIYIDINPEIAIERILERRTCRDCNKIYNLKTVVPQNTGKCDDCGGLLYQRSGDNLHDTRERLLATKKRLEPLIEFCKISKVAKFIHFDGNKGASSCAEEYLRFDEALTK